MNTTKVKKDTVEAESKTILVLGRDRIAGLALARLRSTANVSIVIDESNNLERVVRLLLKKCLSLALLLKMLLCECKRPVNLFRFSKYPSLRSNTKFFQIISGSKPEKIILFRVGLLINQQVLSMGIPVFNVHCASIEKYGGLGSIHRALKDMNLVQHVTLHQVTTTIDHGTVLDVEPFSLSTTESYCWNEEAAYQAGIKLLLRTIEDARSGPLNIGVRCSPR